ncbi:MAG: micrococcal nuclease [Candidatus Peregrinibacteria bacterium Greene0416_19]|nr:MAG: micrococcal nuclease [Candidatus Peregrinibacteria bacterium Greene0416_19]
MRVSLLIVFLLLSACRQAEPVPPQPAQVLPGFARVSRVIDGDTIEVTLHDNATEKIRFIGIDTPETVDPRQPVECFGKEASRNMQSLVAGKAVRLDADPAQERDRYQRLLRYVHVDDQDIGAAMIRDGYALSYKRYPHPRLEEYNALERSAREEGRGLWRACASE